MVKLQKLVAAVALALSLAGCAVGPDYQRPLGVGDVALRLPYQQASQANAWWQAFNDQELDRLVSLALQQNRSLASAAANVRRAMAVFSDTDNDQWPSGSIDSQYQASRNSTFASLDNQQISRGVTLGANLRWDVDLFGKIKRASEAAEANAAQAQAMLFDAQIQIISQVANSYGDYRAAQIQLQVARENVENLHQTHQLVQARVDAGFASNLELARLDVQYQGVKAQIPVLERQLLQARSALSALLGMAPGQLSLSEQGKLPELRGPLAIKDGQDYLHYRADIAIAERALAASTANIGVATADLYPSLSVRGFLGWVSAPGLSLNSQTDAWSVAPALSWQAADLGSVKARIRAADATADMALAHFEQVVFSAINEIQLSLEHYNLIREQLLLTQQQYKASTQALIIARVQYEAGSGEFYALLDAEREWLNSRNNLAQVQQLSFSQLVTIYRVFAGSLAIEQQEV